MSCVLGDIASPITTNRIVGVKEGTRTPRAPFGVPDPQSGRVPITGYNHHLLSRGGRARTDDLMLPKHARYQLRHTPIIGI